MIAYAARTTNKRNLAALTAAGWRILLSPSTGLELRGLRYALDNGAWSAFKNETAFDGDAFMAAVFKIGDGADFVVAPDIVQGGLSSLALSKQWLPWVAERSKITLVPKQDGMEPSDIDPLLGPRVGIFVGGSTEFKERTMAMWAALARDRGALCHVGRVNSARRIALCAAAGVDSFDGSSAAIYAKTLPLLENARQQPDLFA